MIQLVANGVFLDLYENDLPKLTYSIEDITDTKLTSSFSRTFRVPGTDNNAKFFKTAFEVNGFDFDVTQVVTAQLMVDGDIIKEGQLRLNKIYLTNNAQDYDYEILFLGEGRTFVSQVGEGMLSELDLSEINTPISYATVTSSWLGVGNSGGVHNGNVRFPLVDFGNTYDSSGIVEQTRIAIGTGQHFTNGGAPIRPDRFKPMIRAKYLWDKIFAETDYTYTSRFLNDDYDDIFGVLFTRFYDIYVSAWGNEESVGIPASATTYSFFAIDPEVNDGVMAMFFPALAPYVSTIPLTNSTGFTLTNNGFGTVGNFVIPVPIPSVGNPGGHYGADTGIYTVPAGGTYSFTTAVTLAFRFNTANPGLLTTVAIKRFRPSDNTTATLVTANFANNSFETYFALNEYGFYDFGGTVSVTGTGALLTGDQVYVEVTKNTSSPGTYPNQYYRVDFYPNASSFKTILTPVASINMASMIRNDYKKIDFIKDIATKFRLVFAPDPTNPRNFIIEPFEDYIGSGEVLDWSEKLDLSKDIQLEPVFYTQTQKIIFEDKADGDWLSNINKLEFNENFGTLEFNSNIDTLTGERKITTNFASTPVRQIQGYSSGNAYNSLIIPHIYNLEEVEGSSGNSVPRYRPIKPTTRLLYWNGVVDNGEADPASEYWYFRNDSNQAIAQSGYPRVSPFLNFTQSPTSPGVYLDLNWQREKGYIIYNSPFYDPLVWGVPSVYDKFWYDYVNSLYDKWNRKFTATFILDGEDIREFRFSDVIFLKGTYYYVSKISDAPISGKNAVKVELIKYDRFEVPTQGFIPPTDPIVWGSWPDVWNTSTETWGDMFN